VLLCVTLMAKDAQHFFIFFFGHLYFFFWEVSTHIFCPIWVLTVLFSFSKLLDTLENLKAERQQSLQNKYLKILRVAWRHGSVAECLPSMCEGLGSIQSTVKQYYF
jgi:hypothetical protein